MVVIVTNNYDYPRSFIMNLKLLRDNIVGRLRQFTLTRKLIAPIYHLFHKDKPDVVITELRKNFLEKGLNVLETFDKMMSENGFKYSLAFGTMLGAVREKGFIKHDADIDVFMWIEDYNEKFAECLQKNGFSIYHTFSVDNDKLGKEDTIMLDGVQIDIFYIYPPIVGRNLPYCCDFVIHPDCLSREHSVLKYGGLLPRRIEIPISREVVRVPFETLSLPIMTNAHEFLRYRYGEDYMIPNPKWTSGINPNIIPWEGKVAIFK